MQQFTENDGLPSNRVYKSLFDKQGYLWVATDNGIARFNGKTFKTYGRKEGFDDYGAFHIFLDNKGGIWFLSFSGKLFIYSNEHFTLFDKIKHPEANDIRWMCEDSHGNFYFSSGLGSVFRWNENGQWLRLKVADKITTQSVLVNDTTLFVTDNDIIYEVKNFKTIIKYPRVAGSHDYTRFFKLNDTTLILNGSTHFISISTSGVRELGILPSKNIVFFHRNPDSTIWVGSDNGLFKYTSEFSVYTQSYFHASRMTSTDVDFQGNTWISTFNSGLFQVCTFSSLFYPSEKISHFDNPNWIFEIKNEVYSINKHNIFKYKDQKLIHKIQRPERQNIVRKWEKDIVVFGNYEPRIYDGNVFKKFPVKNEGIIELCSNRENKNYLLILNNLGKNSVSSVENGKYVTLYKFDLPFELPKAFYVDKDVRCWVGSKTGLYTYHPKEGLLEIHKSIPQLESFISDIKSDNYGNIWVATKDEGLFCFNGIKLIKHVTSESGLLSNNCNFIYPSENGDLWVGTNAGLNKISNIQNGKMQFTAYTKSNLLPGNLVNSLLIIRDSVFVLTNDGMIVFPESITVKSNSNIPVYIAGVQVSSRDTIVNKTLNIGYKDFIGFNFNGLNYKDPDNVIYKYRLLGLDEKWNYSKSNFVQYNSLKGGNYEFQVYAGSSDGYWSSTPATFSVTVIPPYWQASWFYVLISLSTVGLISLFIYLRYIIRHRETELNNRILENQLKSLRAQINPHFIFNALNSIQESILDAQPRLANTYLSKFAALMRMILENSKKERIQLSEEIKFLHLYMDMERVRFRNDFDFNIDCHPEIETDKIYIPTMLLQPFLENSIKHGLSGKEGVKKLTLSFIPEGKLLNCIIEDNGIGRKMAMEYQQESPRKRISTGIANTNERLQLIYKNRNSAAEALLIEDLIDENQIGIGTRVKVFIPITN